MTTSVKLSANKSVSPIGDKWLVYDCEIIKCIDTGKISQSQRQRYDYCEGWDDFANMGISVVGVADHLGRTFSFSDYGDFPINCLGSYLYQSILMGFKIIGFNNRKFDDNLLYANGIDLSDDEDGINYTWDLLENIRLAAYGSTAWEDTPSGYSYSLQAIAKANGFSKTGTGASAPTLWQDKKYQAVIDYCLNDCLVTRELLLKFLDGKLVDPNTGELLALPKAY